MKIRQSENDLKINMLRILRDKKRKNSPKTDIQSAVSTPVKIDANKFTPRHIIVKLQNVKVS